MDKRQVTMARILGDRLHAVMRYRGVAQPAAGVRQGLPR